MATIVDNAASSTGTSTSGTRLYQRLRTSQSLKHNMLLLGANLGSGVCSYLLHSALGHLLGVAGYGVVASMIALSAVFLMPQQVIGAVVTRYASALSATDNLAQLNDFIRRLTAILLPIGVGVAAVMFAASGPIAQFLQLSSPQLVFITGLMFAISFVSPVNSGVMLGLQRLGWFAAIIVLPMFLRLILGTGLVGLGLGVEGALVGLVLSSFLSYIASFQPLRALLKGPRLPSGSLRSLWSYSMTATMTLAILVLFYNQDTLLAKHFLSMSQAGAYAAVATTGNIIFIISSGVVTAVFPRFVAMNSRGEQTTRTLLEAVGGVLALSVVIDAVLLAVPHLMIRVMFGSTFSIASEYLTWYGIAMSLLSVAQVFIYYFLAADRRLSVLLLLGASGLQIVLFIVRHQTIGQLVQAVVATNGLLVIALITMYVVGIRRTERDDAASAASKILGG